MKIVLKYDVETNQVSDLEDNPIIMWAGLAKYKLKTSSKTGVVLELVKLGIKPDEIIKLQSNGLL